MPRSTRKKLIEKIEKKRGSKVIIYITSDRSGHSTPINNEVVSIIHEHILALNQEDRTKLDLFIYSRGGQSDVPWTIVSMFREYCSSGSFSILVPYRAHSAATVICLGADEIIMTKKAELGPIDITITSGPYNPTEKDSHQRLPISVEDVTGYFALLNRVGCARPDEIMKGFEILSENVHPLALGTVSRLLEETKLVALRLLNTRGEPYSEEENHEIVKRLSSEVYSHNHAISRTEAKKYIGLNQVVNAEDEGIDKEMWNLYKEYLDLFQFETPFLPEEYVIQNDLEEYRWNNQKLACVESLNRFDVCKQDVLVKRLRNIPPKIELHLQDLHLPQINIPEVPKNLDKNQFDNFIKQLVEGVVQQSVDNAVHNAVQQLIQSFSQKGFERMHLNSGWKKEN